jgi:hypothetical protein
MKLSVAGGIGSKGFCIVVIFQLLWFVSNDRTAYLLVCLQHILKMLIINFDFLLFLKH